MFVGYTSVGKEQMQNLSSELDILDNICSGTETGCRVKLIAFRCIEGTVFAVFSLDGLLCFNPIEV